MGARRHSGDEAEMCGLNRMSLSLSMKGRGMRSVLL